jgi:hypothetical protein
MAPIRALCETRKAKNSQRIRIARKPFTSQVLNNRRPVSRPANCQSERDRSWNNPAHATAGGARRTPHRPDGEATTFLKLELHRRVKLRNVLGHYRLVFVTSWRNVYDEA